ncbi:hypothetical protein [Clostridium sporogenes]|uniref:hypothetical protein n=1 Tax=Clostridium sporogenes TaxID=1509 RepID=UPI0013D21254|nr:hypothetical protein [Clostridium sporogenes]NFP92399.1 hypothetical protein [Clostridium sporogenes]
MKLFRNNLKLKNAIKLLRDDFQLKKTIIKRIMLCFFIGVLMELFDLVSYAKEDNISILVAIFIAIISLELKLIYEVADWNP